ncbi:MAG: AAA family ATPase, partial [Verrucomicrobiota bacterium]
FNDKTSTLVGAEHLWDVRSGKQFRRGSGWKTMTTEQILAAGLRIGGHVRWEVPPTPVLQLTKQDLPVDPYLLGVMLGNGGMTSTTPKVSTSHQQQLELICPLLPQGVEINGPFPSDPNIYMLTGGIRGKKNPLTSALRAAGVWGKRDFEKEIPGAYLMSSSEDRLALLQGLMDTDGGASGSRRKFGSASPTLAEQVAWLARSLGGWASINVCPVRERGNYDMHLVTMQLPGSDLFRLDYHKARCVGRHRRPRRGISSIVEEFEGEAVCISVDDPNQRYLTDDLIVTHNTFLARELADELNWDVFATNVSGWIVLGARETPTWHTLVDFLADGDAPKIIILDELDKIAGEDSWTRYLRAELFSVMDGVIPMHTPKEEEGEDPTEKLYRAEIALAKTLVIGCGAFQHLFDEKPGMGFRPAAVEKKKPSKLAQHLQRELVNRFDSDLLILPDLTKEDYKTMLAELGDNLPYDAYEVVKRLGDEQIEEAVENKSGARFSENLLSAAFYEITKDSPLVPYEEKNTDHSMPTQEEVDEQELWSAPVPIDA